MIYVLSLRTCYQILTIRHNYGQQHLAELKRTTNGPKSFHSHTDMLGKRFMFYLYLLPNTGVHSISDDVRVVLH